MKHEPVYLFLNCDDEIVGCILNKSLNGKIKGKITNLMMEAGFDVKQGSALEASILFDKRTF